MGQTDLVGLFIEPNPEGALDAPGKVPGTEL
jgi:hypothetical protein